MEELLLKYLLQNTVSIAISIFMLIHGILALIRHFRGELDYQPLLKTRSIACILVGLLLFTTILTNELIPDLRGYMDIQQNQTETVSGQISEIRSRSNHTSIIVIDGEEYIYFKRMDEYQVYEKLSCTVVYGKDSRYVIEVTVNAPDERSDG